MIGKRIIWISTVLLAALLVIGCAAPAAAPAAQQTGGEAAAQSAPESLVVGYLENQGRLIVGDGRSDMPGLAIELADMMFSNNEKQSYGEDIAALLDAVSSGKVGLALGLPNSADVNERLRASIAAGTSAAAWTDPYFVVDMMMVNEGRLSVDEVNALLRELGESGEIDTLIRQYFDPQRQDVSWVEEMGLTPAEFNPDGLGQFGTQIVYARDLLTQRLDRPIAPLDLLRPISDKSFIMTIESSPDPAQENLFVVTAPVMQSEEVRAGKSGALGIMLRSARPYDIASSSEPSQAGVSGGPLLKVLPIPAESDISVIEWDDANKQIVLTDANGNSNTPELEFFEDGLPPVEDILLVHAEGSTRICVRWDGYRCCWTI